MSPSSPASHRELLFLDLLLLLARLLGLPSLLVLLLRLRVLLLFDLELFRLLLLLASSSSMSL
jgi:hypothetical protein